MERATRREITNQVTLNSTIKYIAETKTRKTINLTKNHLYVTLRSLMAWAPKEFFTWTSQIAERIIPRRVPTKYPIKSYLEKLRKNHSDTQIFTKAGINVSITAILYCFSITHTLYIFLLFTV